MAEHPSLALIESLVNLAGKPQFLPDTYQLLEIDIESTSWKGRKFLVDKHAHVFDRNLAFNESQSIGDSWLKEKRTALAVVPSAPSPFSWNILFNPLHRHARSVRVANSYSLAYDEQLFKASPPNTIHLPLQIERKKRP
jgi:RES domain-containing protein